MAASIKERGVIVKSKVFPLWKTKEIQEGRKITIDTLIEETGLAKLTVRKFIAADGDVSTSPLSSAAVFAEYFGVGLEKIVSIEPAQ